MNLEEKMTKKINVALPAPEEKPSMAERMHRAFAPAPPDQDARPSMAERVRKAVGPVKDRTKVDTLTGPGAEDQDQVSQLTLRLPVALHRGLKVRAAQDGTSCTAIVLELIKEYLGTETQ